MKKTNELKAGVIFPSIFLFSDFICIRAQYKWEQPTHTDMRTKKVDIIQCFLQIYLYDIHFQTCPLWQKSDFHHVRVFTQMSRYPWDLPGPLYLKLPQQGSWDDHPVPVVLSPLFLHYFFHCMCYLFINFLYHSLPLLLVIMNIRMYWFNNSKCIRNVHFLLRFKSDKPWQFSSVC